MRRPCPLREPQASSTPSHLLAFISSQNRLFILGVLDALRVLSAFHEYDGRSVVEAVKVMSGFADACLQGFCYCAVALCALEELRKVGLEHVKTITFLEALNTTSVSEDRLEGRESEGEV